MHSAIDVDTAITHDQTPAPGFSRGRVVGSEQLREWTHPNPWRLAWDLSLLWVQIAVGVALYLAFPHPAVYPLAIVIIAGGQQGLSLAGHEFAHYSILPRHHRLNDLIGTWLFAAPILMPLTLFRIRHFEHHRTYSTERDTKDVYKRDIRGWRLAKELLLSAIGWDFVSHVLETLSGGAGKPGSDAGKLAVLVPLAATQLILLAVFSLWSPWYYLTLWFVPMVTLNWLLRKVRSIMEHQPLLAQGVGRRTGYYRDTPGPYVRTVTASWWERLLLSHLNFCYHAEHHLWPSVSYQHLPRLREALESARAFDDPGIERDETYLSTILRLAGEQAEPPSTPDRVRPAMRQIPLRPPVPTVPKTAVPECPVCGAAARRYRYPVTEHEYSTTTTDAFHLWECTACGAWYLDPRPAVEALEVIYPPNYYTYVHETDPDVSEKHGLLWELGKRFLRKRMAPIQQHVELKPGVRWLDIGCSTGLTLDMVRRVFGAEGEGIDYAQDAVETCRKRGFVAHHGRFEDHQPAGELYDLVYSSHVIEHVVSPLDFMRKSYELLKPGGYAAFITPDTSTWEAHRFGRFWGGLHAPRHFAMLCPRALPVLGERAGLEHVDTSYSTNGAFWVWSLHAWMVKRLGRGVADAVCPSDHRIISDSPINVARISLATLGDVANLIVRGQTANMMAIYRKPA